MPKESTAATPGPPDPAAAPALPPPSAAERARLTQCFQRGTQNAPTNDDYAIEMFTVCVLGDPGNAIYLQSLLAALRKKFGTKKAGGLTALWPAGSRGGLKKLAAGSQWREVLRQGLDILRSNPNDHACLLAMADACGNLSLHDAQRLYLRSALDAAPADPEVNKQCARFLASHGEFDQAIACWRRISTVKGLAEEADRAIADLGVQKTIAAGHGLPGRAAAGGAAKPAADAGTAPVDRVAQLKRDIEERPTATEAYLELADILERDATIKEAEQVLVRALAVSGNDLKVREHYEDRRLRWARHRVHVAEKRVEAEDTQANRATLQQLRAAQLKQETEVYAARSARYPENINWKYELAMRLKAGGNHAEAIRHFQDVLKDARRKGAVSLELGECFQKIRQYQLALQNYVAAIESLTDRELELRKRALYRAGVLAAGLDDADTARKYLSMLAGLDFGYRDVAQRLDKLDSLKDNGSGSDGSDT